MIGKRIKELRNEKGITLKKLGEILNLGESTMSMYENQKRSPDYDTLLKIAEFFNVSTDYLLGKTAFKNPMELFEHWNGQNSPYFESPFDFGELLKEIREVQGVSQQEVSKALDITESDVDDIEEGILPLNYKWAERYANFLGTTIEQIFIDNDMSVSLNNIPIDRLNRFKDLGMTDSEIVKANLEFEQVNYEDAMSDPDNGGNKPETIAAHHDGEDWTEEELNEIEQFKKFVKMKRNQQE